jgi:SAM-dependent methyltransferase
MPGTPALDLQPRYHQHRAPLRLDYAAAVNGVPRSASAGAPFLYLDLACDSGFTLALLAAAWPSGHFIGVAADPARLEHGRVLAGAAGLANVDFIVADPVEWARSGAPEADYLALHGLCNRLGEAVDPPLGQLIAPLLRPGGLAYLGYDALPGWAACMPLRQFLLDELGAAPFPADRLRAALDRLAALRAAGAGYFAQNPSAGRLLDKLCAGDIGELARTLSVPGWTPLHFSAVAEALGAAGLRFVGSADLAHNYARSSVKGAFLPLLLGETDRRRAELHRDLVNHSWFRHDIFTKPLPGSHPPATELIADFVAGSTVPGEIDREISLPDGAIALEGALFDGLRHVLAQRAVPIRELSRLPELRDMPQEAILSAIQLLMLGEQIRPFAGATAPCETLFEPRAGDWRIPLEINRQMLLAASDGAMPLWLVSPALGDAVAVSPDAAALLRGVVTASGEAAANRDGRAPAFAETPPEALPLLRKYVELGIIAPR